MSQHRKPSSVNPAAEAAARSLCTLTRKNRDHEEICRVFIFPSTLLKLVELEMTGHSEEKAEEIDSFYVEDVARKMAKACPHLNIDTAIFVRALVESTNIFTSQLAKEAKKGNKVRLQAIRQMAEKMHKDMIQRIVDEEGLEDLEGVDEEEEANEGL